MQINKVDVIWNYAATFLKIAASSLLLPLILKFMPPEMVGIWSVFVTVNALNSIFDFGFNAAFTRNITYVFSGIQKLEVSGFTSIAEGSKGQVDYGLLKGVIHSMRWFYFRTASVFFLLLSTVGTYYIYTILKNYHGNPTEVYIAWGLLCTINSINLATIYYDSLLQGKGLVKRSKQIVIISQVAYLLIAIVLLLSGQGLIAIVAAQASSVIIVRWLSHRSFFTPVLSGILHAVQARSKREILSAIYPNALKIGLTTLGGVLVQRSALVIGSLYLTLDQIASYGITMQIVSILAGLASVYTATYQAKMVHMRVVGNGQYIKKIYIKGQYVLLLTYLLGGAGLLLIGGWALDIIDSQTKLLPSLLTLLALILSFEQTNLSIAGSILSTKNIIPFFKASLIAGVAIIIGLLISFEYFNIGIAGMLLVPLLVDFSYQAWKWPWEVIKDLRITWADLFRPGN